MKATVVVPNWNGADFLQYCLDSLLSQSHKVDIVVVENGSTDSSTEVLRGYPTVLVLPQPENLGFAGGVNVGIRYALEQGADYILLFNNDAVADKNWAKTLIDTAESEPHSGIITCKLLRDDRRSLDSTGDFYTTVGLPFPRGRDEPDDKQYDKQTTVFGGSGGASLYRAELFRDIGLFDEDFFAYYEDVDLSFRAQLAGWEVRYEPSARAYHQVSATSSKIQYFGVYQTAKNFPYMYIKNMPGHLFFKYLPSVTYWYARMFAARVLRGGWLVFLKGSLVSLCHVPKKVVERRRIQHNRRVRVSVIDAKLYKGRPPIMGEKFNG